MTKEAPSPTAFDLWPYLQDQFLDGRSLLKSPAGTLSPAAFGLQLSQPGWPGRQVGEEGPLTVLWSCYGLLGKHSSLPGSLPPSRL